MTYCQGVLYTVFDGNQLMSVGGSNRPHRQLNRPNALNAVWVEENADQLRMKIKNTAMLFDDQLENAAFYVAV